MWIEKSVTRVTDRHHEAKIDVSCLQTMLTRRNENLGNTFGGSRHIAFREIIDKTLMKTTYNR